MQTPLHYRIRPGALRVIVPGLSVSGVRTIVHLSDLHFGRVDPRIPPPCSAP